MSDKHEIETVRTPSFGLDGRSALVTGAGRGLGAGAAIALAEAGADVVLMSRTESELEIVAERVRREGREATVVVCDVTDTARLEAAIRGLDALDIVVNNAGVNFPMPFLELPVERLAQMLDLNIRACLMVARFSVERMLQSPDRRKRGGAIINMSSQMGHVGAPIRVVYCTTKHGLEGMTKALALELAETGIRVNSVGPTFFETPLARPMLAQPEFRRDVLDRIALGRLGKTEDLMGAIVFLASPAAAMITGTSLLIDGGWTAR